MTAISAAEYAEAFRRATHDLVKETRPTQPVRAAMLLRSTALYGRTTGFLVGEVALRVREARQRAAIDKALHRLWSDNAEDPALWAVAP